ncbi:hypothetical protein CU048_11740 [Beijerinckiaceae bacterium]|nr:hypothetical protein CU048_11740 [Beijerinckiaceae bacterium]
MQQLQQIYTELTGKSETTSKYYDDPIHLSIDDIDQLHHRLMQTWEQYQVVSSTVCFTIYYLRNTKDRFNSFERLKFQISGGAEPVESVLLKYELLVILPNVSKPQTYSISVRLISRLAVERRMRESSIIALPRFIQMMSQHTASVEITYVDYSVARAFMAAIDEWLHTIPRSPENKFMKWLQAYSHWIPKLSQFATAIIVVILVIDILPHFIGGSGSNFLQFSRFFLFSGLGVYVAYTLAGWSASYAERAVDKWTELSYIKFNRGDEIEITKSTRENRFHLIKGALGVVGAVVVDIAAKFIAATAAEYL